MSYRITVHLNVHNCLNTAIGTLQSSWLYDWASLKSTSSDGCRENLEFCVVCSCCIKILPMWINLGSARLSLNTTVGVWFFFFSVLVQCFWHLASHPESHCIFFHILQAGKRRHCQSQGFMPWHAHTRSVQMHTHTFPQSTVCKGDLCIKVCFPCLKISSSVFLLPKTSWSHLSRIMLINFSPLLPAAFLFTWRVSLGVAQRLGLMLKMHIKSVPTSGCLGKTEVLEEKRWGPLHSQMSRFYQCNFNLATLFFP